LPKASDIIEAGSGGVETTYKDLAWIDSRRNDPGWDLNPRFRNGTLEGYLIWLTFPSPIPRQPSSDMHRISLTTLLMATIAGTATADGWLQFRGPNGTGVAVGDQPLPTEIGPDSYVIWKTALPPGHSSPVVTADRIYLTAVKDEQLWTIGLDRSSGEIVWEAETPHSGLEKIHAIGSHAQPSPATDSELVVSFFGSSGLVCHDRDGSHVWRRKLGPFKNTYGAASSPIIVDDIVLLNQDHDEGSFLLALDKATGETKWKVGREEFPRGFSTPIVWNNAGRKQAVVVGALRAIGYDLKTGTEVWTVRGLARITAATPVAAANGMLYIAEWAPGADAGGRIQAEPFEDITAKVDKNENGTIEFDELGVGPLKIRFPQIDRDKDDRITKAEYEWMRNIFHTAQNVLMAVEPGGEGDITDTHVKWTQPRYVPYVPSPLYHDGMVLMVKDGGIVTSHDAETGEMTKRGRVPKTGNYYSSPVVGDGKVYLLSQRGGLTVLSAEPDWQVLHKADFDEETFATPALVDGRIYLRTEKHLYCFGLAE